jgi:hypothetical protein
MPIWGPIFHQIEFDQDLGNVRLEIVVKYLESIQRNCRVARDCTGRLKPLPPDARMRNARENLRLGIRRSGRGGFA